MTAIRMPDLRARHSEPGAAHAVRLPDLRVPEAIRDVGRADGVAVSTGVTVVGAALAGLLPPGSFLHQLGLALVVLGPLGLLSTLTLMPTADAERLEAELARAERSAPPVADGDDLTGDIDERLPRLDLQHSVRP